MDREKDTAEVQKEGRREEIYAESRPIVREISETYRSSKP